MWKRILHRLETLVCLLIVPCSIWIASWGVQKYEKYKHYLKPYTLIMMVDPPAQPVTTVTSEYDTHCPGCKVVTQCDEGKEWRHTVYP
jgi:hypothetical protein